MWYFGMYTIEPHTVNFENVISACARMYKFLLTFAATIHSQLLKLRAVGNPPGKAGIPFRREGQDQLAHTGHRPRTWARLEVIEGLL